MFFLYRRNIIIVLIIISIAIFGILYFGENNSEAVSTPVSNHIVVIDAGHGLPDRWSRSSRWNI